MKTGSINSNRVAWVDYAKGICIVWVVTMYATDYVKEITHSIGWMQAVVDFAQPFRMPDFFMLSGLFVPRVLNRPLRSYTDTKVVHFLYFYVLWATLKFANMHAHDMLSGAWNGLLSDYLRMFIEPPTGPLWFIYELALFFITVRLLRKVPALIVLPLAMAMEIAVTHGDTQLSIKVADKFARYFVFFYSGYLFSDVIFRRAAWMQQHVKTGLAVFTAWFVLNASLVALQWTFLPGMQLVLGFIGAFAVQLAATMLQPLSWTRWIRYLGQHSIVVYLGFVIPLGLMRRLIASPHVPLDLGTLSMVVMILSVGGALLLYWALRNTPLRILFDRPSWAKIDPPRQAVLEGTPAA